VNGRQVCIVFLRQRFVGTDGLRHASLGR
jgi:hypothetical protein